MTVNSLRLGRSVRGRALLRMTGNGPPGSQLRADRRTAMPVRPTAPTVRRRRSDRLSWRPPRDDRAAAGVSGGVAGLGALRRHVRRVCRRASGLAARGLAANLRRQLIYTAGPDLHLFLLRSRRRVHGLLARRQSEPVDQRAGDALPGGGVLAGRPRAAGSGTRAAAVLAEAPPAEDASCLAGTFVGPFLSLAAARRTSCWREYSPAFCPAAWSTAIWRWRAARRAFGAGC